MLFYLLHTSERFSAVLWSKTANLSLTFQNNQEGFPSRGLTAKRRLLQFKITKNGYLRRRGRTECKDLEPSQGRTSRVRSSLDCEDYSIYQVTIAIKDEKDNNFGSLMEVQIWVLRDKSQYESMKTQKLCQYKSMPEFPNRVPKMPYQFLQSCCARNALKKYCFKSIGADLGRFFANKFQVNGQSVTHLKTSRRLGPKIRRRVGPKDEKEQRRE